MATPTNLPATFVAGNILTAAQQNDLRGAFRVLQVKSTTVSAITATTSSDTFVDVTDLTVSITPQSNTSKILVMVNMNVGGNNADDTFYSLCKNNDNINQGSGGTVGATMSYRFTDGGGTAQNNAIINLVTMFLDSPATTSASVYKMKWRTRVGNIYLNRRGSDTAIAVASNITVMEISA